MPDLTQEDYATALRVLDAVDDHLAVELDSVGSTEGLRLLYLGDIQSAVRDARGAVESAGKRLDGGEDA